MRRLKAYLNSHTIRYLTVGILVYLIEIIVIIIAQKLGASSVWSVVWSFGIGLVFSFLLQKLFTFGDRRMQRTIVVPQVIAVVLLVCFNLGFTIIVTKLATNVLPPTITRTIALGVTTIWNYYLYKTRIFNQGKQDEIIPID